MEFQEAEVQRLLRLIDPDWQEELEPKLRELASNCYNAGYGFAEDLFREV